ncbi:helix-turn-helix domain-containing protein [Streptomyces noursei]|uniref:helix-turn-helix domain-containing protein n=1 Tax=Streptomyces noursei TaxID=1971 RepID=UPI001963A71A|nr:helix-turn-helix domain-containing protein [Streptomyces noursei]QRX96398.1 helix-turn-helix domain-containing protein [Streptomyces noursei]
MRYKVTATRIQLCERFIRAADRDTAAKKVQEELDRPYGHVGTWCTKDTNLDVQECEENLGKATDPVDEGGPLVMSVKEAAAHLGVSRSVMYELVRTGEIGHLPLGHRKMISRKAMETFVEANTRNRSGQL